MSKTHTSPVAATPSAEPARVPTGIDGLDAMVEGGFPAGRSVLVCGRPGTGKSTFAAQFLAAGIGRGEPGLLVSVDQKPRHALEDAGRFGWDLEGAMARGILAVLDAAPYFTASRDASKRVDARQLAAELARRTRQIRARRLAIDSLASLVPADAPRDAIRDFLRSLIFSIEDNLGCTAVLTWPDHGLAPNGDAAARAEASTLASGVLELRLAGRADGRYQRRLFLRKMRATRAEPAERAYTIDERGIVLDASSS